MKAFIEIEYQRGQWNHKFNFVRVQEANTPEGALLVKTIEHMVGTLNDATAVTPEPQAPEVVEAPKVIIHEVEAPKVEVSKEEIAELTADPFAAPVVEPEPPAPAPVVEESPAEQPVIDEVTTAEVKSKGNKSKGK